MNTYRLGSRVTRPAPGHKRAISLRRQGSDTVMNGKPHAQVKATYGLDLSDSHSASASSILVTRSTQKRHVRHVITSLLR